MPDIEMVGGDSSEAECKSIFPILKLPTELRLQIYDHLFAACNYCRPGSSIYALNLGPPRPRNIKYVEEKLSPFLTFLHVNRQIRREISDHTIKN